MRALIVDDEPLARDGLRLLLAEFPDVQLVGEAGNGHDALALVDAVDPDLLFVDIQMPEMNGLELAMALAEDTTDDRDRAIIFVTAYDEFALRAFDVHALDYVLKPIEEQRFAEAIRRARTQHHARALQARLRDALSTLEAPAPSTRLSIRDGDAVVLLPVDEIDWIEAADYYVEIHAGGKTYLHRETMAKLQGRLDDRFVRIHRSRLVNRDRVRELRWEQGGMVVITTCGASLKVARSARAKLQALR
jgi:two-component system LytT family response regulator